MICTPATRDYNVMTRANWMPPTHRRSDLIVFPLHPARQRIATIHLRRTSPDPIIPIYATAVSGGSVMRSVLLGLCLLGCVGCGKRDRAPGGGLPAAAEAERISAVDLYRTYDNNISGGGSKYNNKQIVVHGRVQRVEDVGGGYLLLFRITPDQADYQRSVVAEYPTSQRNDVDPVKIGEEVEITGHCSGSKVDARGVKGFVVVMRGCSRPTRKDAK
jgi:hypothetical protein